MKANVVIGDGKTEIVLTAENKFEADVIENTIDGDYELTKTTITSDFRHHMHENHRIEIEIEKHDTSK